MVEQDQSIYSKCFKQGSKDGVIE